MLIKSIVLKTVCQRCYESYERYSGELQIVLKNLPQDNRVNVIGYIEEEERWKLQYYRQGYDYIFYVT